VTRRQPSRVTIRPGTRGRRDGGCSPARSRRRAVVAGGLAGYFARPGSRPAGTAGGAADDTTRPSRSTNPQAGIATRPGPLAFGALSVVPGAPALTSVTCCASGDRAARMTAGEPVGEDTQPYAPP